MKIRLSGIEKESIVDGPGLRYVLFSQGCIHMCPGCHNPQTHGFTGGEMYDAEDLVREICENPLLSGVTFSGGDPFNQAEAFSFIAKLLKEKGMDIWSYTGYTIEELRSSRDPFQKELLAQVDVLVEGRFVQSLRTLSKPFAGSSNQRVIDLQKSTMDHIVEVVTEEPLEIAF
jgi:anaerobic ribonucleoside-triphosphate reductase activating protein